METTTRRLVAGTTFLVLVDLIGGLLAVRTDLNTWGEAWGGEALLAAPVPMIAAQVVLTAVAALRRRAAAGVAGGLLAVACLLSVVSAFFDGALGNDALSPALQGYQLFLLAATAGVGLLAANRSATVIGLRASPR
jgi:hypothetical protein